MPAARTMLFALAGVAIAAGAYSADDEARAARQVELDAACEAAREAKLAPLKSQYIEECVAKEQRQDRAACERFYADYGNRSGNQAPLFYDLPECVAAHNHRLGKE